LCFCGNLLRADRFEHGDDVLGGHVGHDVVDLLKHEAAAGPEDVDLLPHVPPGVMPRLQNTLITIPCCLRAIIFDASGMGESIPAQTVRP